LPSGNGIILIFHLVFFGFVIALHHKYHLSKYSIQ